MNRESVISNRVVLDVLSAYPQNPPNEQDRKHWREESEKRRRKEGIRPRSHA